MTQTQFVVGIIIALILKDAIDHGYCYLNNYLQYYLRPKGTITGSSDLYRVPTSDFKTVSIVGVWYVQAIANGYLFEVDSTHIVTINEYLHYTEKNGDKHMAIPEHFKLLDKNKDEIPMD